MTNGDFGITRLAAMASKRPPAKHLDQRADRAFLTVIHRRSGSERQTNRPKQIRRRDASSFAVIEFREQERLQ
jgi:hypothetical protein